MPSPDTIVKEICEQFFTPTHSLSAFHLTKEKNEPKGLAVLPRLLPVTLIKAHRSQIVYYFPTKWCFSHFKNGSQTPLGHKWNPSYSGGRDQEAQGLKQPRQTVYKTPSQKTPSQKKGWWNGSHTESTCLVSMRLWVQNPCYQRIIVIKKKVGTIFLHMTKKNYEPELPSWATVKLPQSSISTLGLNWVSYLCDGLDMERVH
jgi:hypothetical protein